MPSPPFTGNRGALSPHLPLRGHLLPQGEKALGLFFTDSRLRRFVILIQRRGVAAVQGVAGQGRQQLPAEVEGLLHRAVGVALADELLLKRAAKGHQLLIALGQLLLADDAGQRLGVLHLGVAGEPRV